MKTKKLKFQKHAKSINYLPGAYFIDAYVIITYGIAA